MMGTIIARRGRPCCTILEENWHKFARVREFLCWRHDATREFTASLALLLEAAAFQFRNLQYFYRSRHFLKIVVPADIITLDQIDYPIENYLTTAAKNCFFGSVGSKVNLGCFYCNMDLKHLFHEKGSKC